VTHEEVRYKFRVFEAHLETDPVKQQLELEKLYRENPTAFNAAMAEWQRTLREVDRAIEATYLSWRA
jgi:hypothetical protein